MPRSPPFARHAVVRGRCSYVSVTIQTAPPTSFEELVRRATVENVTPQGVAPYLYQQQIADKGFPDLLRAPTGSGKTVAAILPWVWRRMFHPELNVRSVTPRRLVVALPTRALISQTEDTVRRWLSNLGLTEAVPVYAMMGGGRFRGGDQQAWRLGLHQPSIVIGTLDMIVSRCLVRGYGVARGSYAVDFALLANGCQVVVDEIQLVPQATATLRQLAAFQRRSGTAEPSGFTVMSATVDDRVLDTVDNRYPAAGSRVITLDDADISGGMATRLAGTRTVRQLADTMLTGKDLAQAILDRHVEGSLTLAVVNTVETATETYRALTKLPGADAIPRLLIHSRFRAVERRAQLDRLKAIATDGGIVIATQSIEAGVDIDSRTLITEAAPWSSIVQRAGRCNRAGLLPVGDASLWWFPSKTGKHPYDDVDVSGAQNALQQMEGEAATFTRLGEKGSELAQPDLKLRMLRWRDFEQLFDTTPDLSGSDIDVSVYIRNADDHERDAQVAWVPAGWVTHEPGDNAGRAKYPDEALRCPASLGKIKDLVTRDDVTAWVFDQTRDAWVGARGHALRPHDVVLVLDRCGGYDPATGFDPKSKQPVDADPRPDNTPAETRTVPESASVGEEPGAASPLSLWVPLVQHLADAGDQARALTEALDPPGVSAELRRVVYAAAALHDLGKAHPDWQTALKNANPGDQPPHDAAYAKSPGQTALRVQRTDGTDRPLPRTGFRHELITLFMLSTQAARDHLDRLDVPAERHDLVRYLAAAHHGIIRLTARDPQWDGRDGTSLLGCQHDEPTPAWRVDGHELPVSHVDLGIFKTGRQDSWSDAARALLDELGPFRLAYLETLVRMADWRASAGLPLAGVQ